jgi:hypothetical protein
MLDLDVFHGLDVSEHAEEEIAGTDALPKIIPNMRRPSCLGCCDCHWQAIAILVRTWTAEAELETAGASTEESVCIPIPADDIQ